ncbi:hypothetical protein X888_3017 [Burkholderia pseudomallei MSHR4377]|uniref:hypothetical protein n=1 Tax=Burkholderia pseudomallei TaxID=28450 RepID=UPI0005375E84|nr:hypothetical protein [Burkholderia pseudomallei]KGU94131.1 hypothetical protein X888_3017 [Burkholderia pseudomallei MSHR4377]
MQKKSPKITAQFLRDLFEQAVEDFLCVDADAIRIHVSERNHCARLAHFLQNRAEQVGLLEYFADVEWNRKQEGKVKTVKTQARDDDGRLEETVVDITSDLLLHSRGWHTRIDNLITVEMKKPGGRGEKKDRIRLETMTTPLYPDHPTQIYSYGGPPPEDVCGYVIGAFLRIERDHLVIEYYEKGAYSNSEKLLIPAASKGKPTMNSIAQKIDC